ncbi:small integral membrane protein 27-like [Oncorhynchus tshawytscha]|uniref:small integral membrane protein 27 n=1 Tax=Oncorhynchus kisutch TaxID=8019 RepID=UPI001131ABB4|nr:small integral membrane protein 27 [Oncorhynchus nerka]XP_031647438.1 small integral membrane protein 27 [Oncorhynchus kisutch]XP_042183917.1 small integral membrane protein 27-like [Oncorhynchus tshawytscha]
MMNISNRALDRLYSVLLLAVVVLSWTYVIYGSRIAAQRQLEKRLNIKLHN